MKIENKTQQELWDKISEFSLDNPNASFSFSKRLARENGWTNTFSNKVIDEYKKFLYLSVISGKSLTPSDEVDQVWHLHMIYTDSYWNDLCKNTLGIKFHHGPTKGGQKEGSKYAEQYQFTLDFYKSIFECNAPSDAWPSVEKRFANVVYKRVNMHENFVVNKKNVKQYMTFYALLLIGVFACGTLMSASSESQIDWESTLLIIGSIIAGIFIIRGIYRYINRDERSSNSSSSSSSSSDSGTGCTIAGSFFGCGSDSSSSHGCGSSHGCSSGGDSGGGDGGGCGGGGCGGCGG
jgi:hypothetical protein